MGHAKDVGQYLKDLFIGLQKKHKVDRNGGNIEQKRLQLKYINVELTVFSLKR